MNKKILAAAALAVVSGSALADAKLYGIMDLSVANISNTTTTNQTQSGMQDGLWLPSLWGITGGEDLGDGMKAFFDLQSNLTMTNGNAAFGTSQLFDRAAYVGISGDFGKVAAGERLDPLWLQSIVEQAMGVHHSGSAALQSLSYQGQGAGSLGAYGTSTVGPVMSANWLYYDAPKLVDNLSLAAGYQFGNVAGSTSDSAGYYFGGTYAKNGLTVNAAYETQNDSLNTARLNRTLVGAMYTFGDVTVEGQVVNAKTQGAPTFAVDANIGQVGLAYALNPKLKVGAQYVWVNDNVAHIRPTLTSISLTYALSARTNLYVQTEAQAGTGAVASSTVSVSGCTSTTYSAPSVYGVGYSYNASSINANSSLVAVGMNHSF